MSIYSRLVFTLMTRCSRHKKYAVSKIVAASLEARGVFKVITASLEAMFWISSSIERTARLATTCQIKDLYISVIANFFRQGKSNEVKMYL